MAMVISFHFLTFPSLDVDEFQMDAFTNATVTAIASFIHLPLKLLVEVEVTTFEEVEAFIFLQFGLDQTSH